MKKLLKAMTRADKLVVKALLCLILMSAAVACLTSCSQSEEPEALKDGPQLVTLTFSPYDVSPMTRAATSISNYCTHLDVWISDGTTTTDIHQSSTDASFGSVSLPLDRTKTYTLTAVAHKCADDATLTDGVISFPDDKVTHSMVYTTTFSPATTTSLSCQMQRIVGQFRLEIIDVVPDEVAKFTYSIDGTHCEWNTDGYAANDYDRSGTINLTARNNDGSASINMFVMPTNLTDTDNITVTVMAMTASDDIVEQKTFAAVPIKAGYRTTYRGEFFTTEQMTMTFVANDWSVFDTTDF